MIEAEGQGLIELVTHLVCTILTHTRRIVGDIAGSTVGEEVAHVLAAGLARRGGEGVVLGGGAVDGAAFEFGHHLYSRVSSLRQNSNA